MEILLELYSLTMENPIDITIEATQYERESVLSDVSVSG